MATGASGPTRLAYDGKARRNNRASGVHGAANHFYEFIKISLDISFTVVLGKCQM